MHAYRVRRANVFAERERVRGKVREGERGRGGPTWVRRPLLVPPTGRFLVPGIPGARSF